jgi:hypothetical protein
MVRSGIALGMFEYHRSASVARGWRLPDSEIVAAYGEYRRCGQQVQLTAECLGIKPSVLRNRLRIGVKRGLFVLSSYSERAREIERETYAVWLKVGKSQRRAAALLGVAPKTVGDRLANGGARGLFEFTPQKRGKNASDREIRRAYEMFCKFGSVTLAAAALGLRAQRVHRHLVIGAERGLWKYAPRHRSAMWNAQALRKHVAGVARSLPLGAVMPGCRLVAARLRCSKNSVNSAYRQLVHDGVLAVHGDEQRRRYVVARTSRKAA